MVTVGTGSCLCSDHQDRDACVLRLGNVLSGMPRWVSFAGLTMPCAIETSPPPMCGAQISHASLREPKSVAINLALLIPCAFVAAGRLAQLF